MKTLTILILFICSQLFSQWSADTRLTNNSSISYTSVNNARCIAAAGPLVFAVWFDNRDGNFEIYFKRSTDSGITWSADGRLTNDAAVSEFPAIEASSGIIHVFWRDLRDGNGEIYYKRSTNGGLNWSADTRLTNNTSNSEYPSASSDGNTVLVTWTDNRDGNKEIYIKRSTDGGISWGSDVRLINNSAISDFPSVSFAGNIGHLVWREFRDGPPQIYYKRSTDGGNTWGTDTRIVNTSGNAEYASVSASGANVNITWSDDRNTDIELYHKRSTDGGTTWGTDTRLTNSAGNSDYSSVIASGVYVHVVWQDERNGNQQIYYKQSTNSGVTWGADTRLTNNSFNSYQPSIGFSGQVLQVLWEDTRDGNSEIYYKRNPTGNPVGITTLNNELPGKFSLFQNYPNPFNPVTNIVFSIPNAGFTKLVIYDALGREIESLVNSDLNPGTYKAQWDASKINSGVYFYRLYSGSYSETKKMMLIK